jgi:hypothetical protein
MNDENRFKITSNEYADLIVDELAIPYVTTLYPDTSFNRINNIYSIAYFPVTYFSENTIYDLGYDRIPKLYGLMSDSSWNPTEVLQTYQYSNDDLKGAGVLIGFIDTGIDYQNKVFQYPNHTSKIISIWDQTINDGNNYPEGFYYGTEYLQEDINAALNSEDPYSVVPSTDDIGHGTILAGIAGGTYDSENNYIGVAPDSELVIVKLKLAKPYLKDFFYIPQDTICYQENDIMVGINYLVQKAEKLNRPIVICIGLGSSQGAHLGEGIFNNFLSTMGQLSTVAIVVAAGNEGSSGHHYYGEINSETNYNDVLLTIDDNNPGFFMEFWGNAPNVFTIDIFSPGDEFLGHIPSVFLQRSSIQVSHESSEVIIDNILESSLGGDQFILFRFRNPMSGIWRFHITSLGNLLSFFHIWLPISNFVKEGTFFVNSNPYTTITTPGNEKTVLTVTAYDTTNQTLYEYASKGFTKDNQPKPDITAPGVNLLVPGLNNQYIIYSGTSASAAYAAGVVAQLQEWGIVRGQQTVLTSAKVRSILTIGAVREEDIIYPNPNWGFGIIDLDNAIVKAYTY